MKPIFVICALFTVCVWAIFCADTPALAADFGSHEAAANSYRQNLPQLRSSSALEPEPSYIKNTVETQEPSVLNASPNRAAEPFVSNAAEEQAEEQAEESPISDESFFTNAFNNRFSYHRRSPYAVIAAALRADSTPQHSFVPPRFAEQLPKQLAQLRPAIEQRVNVMNRRINQIPQTIKAALSNVLDRVSIQAHRTAEQLRQP